VYVPGELSSSLRREQGPWLKDLRV
jgi:hypothetical protein